MTSLKKISSLMAQDIPQIVSVGLVKGNTILVGQRRDNDKWTFPGGHMDKGETPLEAAKRELKEETGLSVESLRLLKAEKFKSPNTGKEIVVYAFTGGARGNEIAFNALDPDKEFKQLKWVPLAADTDELLPKNSHAPRNIVLEGLLK